MTGDNNAAGDVVERPGLDPLLVADRLARLAAGLLTASPDLLGEISGDPERLLRNWARAFGPEPAERVPRDLMPAGPRLPGGAERDALALIEAAGRADEDAIHAVLASADQVGLPLALAQLCAELARELPEDARAAWLDSYRQAAERMDQE